MTAVERFLAIPDELGASLSRSERMADGLFWWVACVYAGPPRHIHAFGSGRSIEAACAEALAKLEKAK